MRDAKLAGCQPVHDLPGHVAGTFAVGADFAVCTRSKVDATKAKQPAEGYSVTAIDEQLEYGETLLRNLTV